MTDLMDYKCPCCNGSIEFNSSVQKMKCPYCDSEFEMDALKEFDDSLSDEAADNLTLSAPEADEWTAEETSGMSVYVCNNCGGEIVAGENTAATACPYCDSPVVMKGNFSGGLKPELVIPFKISKEQAVEALKKHYQGKMLLPKVFREQNRLEEIKGVYVPFWLFDADADASVRYKAEKRRRFSDENYDYTETKFYSVLRAGSISFEHVPADGSSQMPDDLMDSIEPYSFDGAVDFQTAYLAGYLADKYDVSAEDNMERVQTRMKNTTEEQFRATVTGYDSVITEHCNINLKSSKTRYALYPVWLLTTNWNGERYTFAMNGQTGKFVGNLPCDMGAFWKWFFISGAIGSVVCGIIGAIISSM